MVIHFGMFVYLSVWRLTQKRLLRLTSFFTYDLPTTDRNCTSSPGPVCINCSVCHKNMTV